MALARSEFRRATPSGFENPRARFGGTSLPLAAERSASTWADPFTSPPARNDECAEPRRKTSDPWLGGGSRFSGVRRGFRLLFPGARLRTRFGLDGWFSRPDRGQVRAAVLKWATRGRRVWYRTWARCEGS